METQEQRVIFNLPEETTFIDVADRILANNGLAESSAEFYEKDIAGLEPRLLIVRDAAISAFLKKAPENVIIDLLKKHLETSQETAENIFREVNEKLLPYAKLYAEPIEETNSAQEIILKKIQGQKVPIKQAPAPKNYPKEVEHASVEENARQLQKARTVIQQEEAKKGPDAYREPID